MKPNITRSVFIFTAYVTLLALPVSAQDVPPSQTQLKELPAVANPATATPLPSLADLTARRLVASQDTDLDEATKVTIDQHFAKSIENLQAIEQAERSTSGLVTELDGAPQRVIELQQRLGTPLKEDAIPANASDVIGLDALAMRLKETETAATAARQNNQDTAAEVERRAVRRSQLTDLRAQANQQLAEVGQLLLAPNPDDEHPQVTAIRIIRLQSRQLRLRRELTLLEQEARTYEGTTRLWTLQRDLAERDVREADRIVQFWQQKTAEARRIQADDEARAARVALALSHESVRKEAERNRELADQNAKIVELRQTTRIELDRLDANFNTRSQAFESLKKRSEAAEFSPAIGVLLRTQRTTLPDRDDMRFRIHERQAEISSLNLQLMEWEAERKPLIDLTSAAAKIIEKLETFPESITATDLQEQVQVILAARLQRLGDLIENGGAQLDQLVQVDGQEKQLLAKVNEESLWLAEHVLWVRSSGIIGTQHQAFLKSASTFFDKNAWSRTIRILQDDASTHRWGWGGICVGLLLLFVARRRAKRQIRSLGEIAARSNCVELRPTLVTLLLTGIVALPLPLSLCCLGLRIEAISSGENTLQALGVAMQIAAIAWLSIDLIRQVAQPDNLGDSHFEWSETSMTSVRRTMHILSITALPCLLLVAYTEVLSDEEMLSSIGRLAYLVAMAWAGFASFRLFRPDSAILQALENEHPKDLLWRTRWFWTGLLLLSPIVLSALSATGYHYTAVQLSVRMAATIGSGLAALIVTAFLSRWLLVSYRKLAIQRGRERRRQLLQAAQADSDQPIPQDTTPELRLADINDQTSRLLQLGASLITLIALYAIWIDVLPALGILGKFELWPNTLVTVAGELPVVWVTAADVMIAVSIGVLTIFASRNIPGLMEISILQRLPLDAGARYAVSTVSRYLIIVTGFLFGFRAIGIGWSSVQWLVAAVTVGLGFGLQEIFANFVSGIILLFERPIRIGDTVTVSNITGTVTRIQIRATTILDWDNKELIVPNREFVTGNLVNWTLSSPTLRLIVTVGVAYGSDTRLATRLLYQVAQENALVLDDPEPVVVFTEFGESSLNFELRLYVNGLQNYRRLKHDLHLAVDDFFREHQIEIAFPQRDLHVRTFPKELTMPQQQDAGTMDCPVPQVFDPAHQKKSV